MTAADLDAMRRALVLAAEAGAAGDVPVGAVVLDARGAVIGEGRNLREQTHDPTAHAEIIALRASAEKHGGWNLEQHTLVVTLEPCAMCAGAMVGARVRTVVFGAWEPRTGACGSVFDVARESPLHAVEVRGGVLLDECEDLVREFFSSRR